ncbi:hypothetical protein Pan44_01630 [Caulifigura coniformis]|uniref:Uncharacterized protein n=1 Tax=Caulifigura coniformis TaxID=2527983 RepID=A0A517S7S7_9PLAN|nr:hypothetical protein [Caulifigura coniformis]QDT52154.1 hypothetical protein Pan44_01630 [Caulifigura coniformis]
MRVRGQELVGVGSQRVSLVRGDGSVLPLLIRPLPLGFHRRLRTLGLVPPQPPMRVARDAGGSPLRDAQGHAVTLRDESDAAYLAAVEFYHQRVAVLAVAEALRDDPDVEWTATPPAAGLTEPAGWTAYADALFAELEAAGFTSGDLTRLCGLICRVSRLLDEHLRDARGNFSLPDNVGPA